jgi:hypothetical protein
MSIVLHDVATTAIDGFRGWVPAFALALQLHFLEISESMGNHDSKIVDAGSID